MKKILGLLLLVATCFAVDKATMPTDFSSVSSGTRANLKANFDEITSKFNISVDTLVQTRTRFSAYTTNFLITSLSNLRLKLDNDDNETSIFTIESGDGDSLFRVSEDSTARFFGNVTGKKFTLTDSLIATTLKGTGNLNITGTGTVGGTLGVTGKATFSDSIVGVSQSLTGGLKIAGQQSFTTNGLIILSTSDGADNASLTLSGSVGADNSRGGYLTLYGNEHVSAPGSVTIGAGLGNGRINLQGTLTAVESTLTVGQYIGFNNNPLAYSSGSSSPRIYSTGSIGANPFNEVGNLILQSASNTNKDIAFVTGSTPAIRLRIDELNTAISTTLSTTGLHTAAGGINYSGGTWADGSIYSTSQLGLALAGKTGSLYDLALMGQDAYYLIVNPTGTQNLLFPAAGTNTFSGKLVASDSIVGVSQRLTGNLAVVGTLGTTGLYTATGGINIAGGSYAVGNIYSTAGLGMVLAGKTGSTYDFSILAASGAYLIRNPPGTTALELPGASGITVTGPATLSSTLTINGRITGNNDATFNLNDNASDVFLVQQAANKYITVTTTNSSEVVAIGNTTTNPTVNFLGSGTKAFSGAVTAASTLAVTGKATFSDSIVGVSQSLTGNLVATGTISSGNETFEYDEGTYTATLTGVTTTVNGTARYTKVGSTVTVYIPFLTGTSNTTAATLTGAPAAIYPLRAQNIVVPSVGDNASDYLGKISVGTDGVMTLSLKSSLTASFSPGFTNSGTKLINACTITYTVQ